MTDFSNLNKTEIGKLLKKLKLLNALKKSLGKRGEKEFNKIEKGVNSYVVEYSQNLEENFLKENSLLAFKKLFGLELKIEDLSFVLNKDLKGGFRIFFNDNMYDLSYVRFENYLRK